ncbi:hypothetical protein ColKHC_00108 [Colletotrichum higginsianum]|nr:hypothetical protein ColKHC_00108 [Colletotrichum higginsianum]
MKRTVDDATHAENDDLAITAINELREQNQAMQDAITSLARVAARLGSTELQTAVRDAQSAAGMEDHDDGHDYDNSPGEQGEPSQRRPSVPSTSYQSVMVGSGNMLGKGPAGGAPAPFPFGGYQARLQSNLDEVPGSQNDENGTGGQQPGYQSGRMSPRLSYGLFLERPLFRLTNPPVDIMPFLESNKTLASVLFWTGLVWGFKLLQAAIGGNEQAVATANKIFGEIAPMTPKRIVLNGIHARIKFRNMGYIESDHPGYDPEGGSQSEIKCPMYARPGGRPWKRTCGLTELKNTFDRDSDRAIA